MATRKQFIELRAYWPDGGPKRNSPVGGVVVGDYYDEKTGDRVVLVKMPKVEKKAAKKTKPRSGSSGSTGQTTVGPISTPAVTAGV